MTPLPSSRQTLGEEESHHFHQVIVDPLWAIFIIHSPHLPTSPFHEMAETTEDKGAYVEQKEIPIVVLVLLVHASNSAFTIKVILRPESNVRKQANEEVRAKTLEQYHKGSPI